MGSLGEELRRAREEKGVSLREAEEATKIRLRYLAALEKEEFQALPGRVYTIGFLRIYASYLGLDAERLVHQLKTFLSDNSLSPPVRTRRVVRPSGQKRKRKAWPLILIGLVLLAFIFFVYLFYPFSLLPPEGQEPSSLPPEVTPGERLPPEEEGTPMTEIELVVVAEKGDCWLEVWRGENQVFSGTLQRGAEKTFRGKEKLLVKFGDAGAVRVFQNGKDLGSPGRRGEVLKREFSL